MKDTVDSLQKTVATFLIMSTSVTGRIISAMEKADATSTMALCTKGSGREATGMVSAHLS